MPFVTVHLYEQRWNFLTIWSYRWHQLFWLTSIHSIPDVSWNHLFLFSGLVVQTVWPTLRLHGGKCNSDLISTVHLLDHSDWFRNDSCDSDWSSDAQSWVFLNCGGEAQKLSLLRLLCFVGWNAQTSRAYHIKWASQRMKPVWREVEPNDGETWVLTTMFVPLDPTVPEASISPGLFSYVNQ